MVKRGIDSMALPGILQLASGAKSKPRRPVPVTEDDVAAAIAERLSSGLGIEPELATLQDWFQATALTVRETLVKRWHDSNRETRERHPKQVSYLSMEFLVARELENALFASGQLTQYRAALSRFGVSLDDLMALETDPALGNGGLGRLAACFLDSAACLDVPCVGYGIRYEFGMFKQRIVDGWQVEVPDDWLERANPWEFARPQRFYRIRFGGHVEHRDRMAHWVGTDDVYAMAYDTLIPGHGSAMVNTLRLWRAKPVGTMDLSAFNRGAHVEASADKVRSETITSVLYPDDSTEQGRELRLRQEHFFVSASVQDVVARFLSGSAGDEDPWDGLPRKMAIHLNDTHPALAPAELIRLLVDEHGLEWERAWRLTRETFSYTNHTLMPEALEIWPGAMFARILPRHHEIIAEINRRFLARVSARAGPDPRLARNVEVIHSDSGNINMGRFSVVASRRVNGVSQLHSRLMREHLFYDYARLFPERFDSITNGITPRRWLLQANPRLSALVDATIGTGWRQDFTRLGAFAAHRSDAGLGDRLMRVKRDNKVRFGNWLGEKLDISVDPDAMLDVQIKRVHEYKRQLLNVLGVIARWNAMHAAPGREWPACTVVIAGKAASAYWMAKLIIKLAHDVAQRINRDPVTGDRLKLVFLPNYGVSLAQLVIPAADVSQQISLAGKEASGTSNMKLALNGALSLATADGANIEIADAVGHDNIFMFGMQVEDVARLQTRGYNARDVYMADPALRTVLDQIADGTFCPDEPDRFRPIVESLLVHNDPYFVLADFAAYQAARRDMDANWADRASWAAKAVSNIAGMSNFSSDRAVHEYADRIWRSLAPA
jgi:starch phosphorylase